MNTFSKLYDSCIQIFYITYTLEIIRDICKSSYTYLRLKYNYYIYIYILLPVPHKYIYIFLYIFFYYHDFNCIKFLLRKLYTIRTQLGFIQ